MRMRYFIRFLSLLFTPILLLFVPRDKIPTITGDLEEGAARLSEGNNAISAVAWYTWQIVLIISGRIYNMIFWSAPMFKSNSVTLFRNLVKYKVYSAVNILGLAIGMACFIVLYIHISHELSFDRFHRNADRIYRVAVEFTRDGRLDPYAQTQALLAETLMKEFPEIEHAITTNDDIPGGSRVVVSYNNNHFELENLICTDPGFFTMFSFPLVSGNPETALSDVHSVLISENYSRKLFGLQNPIGETITVKTPGDYSQDFTITGVFRDVPENSQLQFDAVFSFNLQRSSLSWGAWNYFTYVMLIDPANATDLEAKFPAFEEKYLNKASAQSSRYFLQPLTSIHLHSDLRSDLNTNSSILYIYFLVTIAFVILCIASINFMNLSTAQSIRRAKEIGVRKSLGASRGKLIRQFLQEAVLFSVIAALLSILFANLFMPPFNSMIGGNYKVTYEFLLNNSPALILFSLFVGIGAGLYPALYISSIKPTEILKSGVAKVEGGKLYIFQKSLVVFQFTVSVSFIIAALVIQNQINYIHSMNLGYERENLIYITFDDRDFLQKSDLIKERLNNVPGVLGATVTSYLPSNQGYNQGVWLEGMPRNDYLRSSWLGADHDFIKTFKIEMLEGRDFSADIKSDYNGAYILNETAVKTFDIDDPIGKKIRIVDEGTIIGIARDFHFKSVYHEIEPFILYYYPNISSFLYIRLDGNSLQESIASIKTVWESVLPEIPFRYSFLDEDFDRIYKSESQLQQVFMYATILAFIIACLGLYALVSYSTEQRKKEIGIRKVLGAQVSSIFGILVRDYFVLVLIANAISLPVVYLLSRNWLENFVYHAELGGASFLLASTLSFVLALTAVGIQSVKAALINPINTLKDE